MVLEIIKRDDKDRIVRGWGSVEIKDRQGDIIPVEELEKIMDKIMDRGGVILDSHSNRPVGKILNYEIKDHPSGNKGIYLTVKIHDDYPLDDEVWEKIKAGKITGFSFGGRGQLKEIKVDEESGDTAKVIGDLEGYEFSTVENPANPLATIEEVNMLAKGDLKKHIRHEGGKWVVYSESGKKMGEYSTEQEAKERLRQIHYFESQKNMETKKQDGRPPKEWWDRCVARAGDFATDPAKFCGALWYDPERFVGGTAMREAFGKEEEVDKEMLKGMVEEYDAETQIRLNKGLIEDIMIKLSRISEKLKRNKQFIKPKLPPLQPRRRRRKPTIGIVFGKK